jgi:hypothetical protein
MSARRTSDIQGSRSQTNSCSDTRREANGANKTRQPSSTYDPSIDQTSLITEEMTIRDIGFGRKGFLNDATAKEAIAKTQ